MDHRKCFEITHEYKQIEFICIHSDCKIYRYVCSQCLLEQIHQHGEQNLNHIMDKKKIQLMAEQSIKKMNNFLNLYFKYYQKIIKEVKVMIDLLQQLILSINHQRTVYEEQIKFMKQKSYTLQDQQEILQIINLEQYQKNFIKQLSQMKYETQKINQNAQKCLDKFIEKQDYSKKIQNAKTQIIQMDQTQDKSIQTVSISQDLKYLVSGGSEKILKIWDFDLYNLVKEISLENSLMKCQFTSDSKFLYVGISGGYLYQFDVENTFKEIYKQKVHPSGIVNIYCITNFILLTSSWDKTIAKLNTKNRQYLFQFQAHNDVICGLDYHIQKKIIITCSDDKSFKIWKENQLFLENPQEHKTTAIKQILFIQDKDQIIHLDSIGIIKLWQINFINKTLLLIYSIADKLSIYNISMVMNQQYILAIGNKQIQIYSKSGQCIKQFDHQVYKLCQYNQVQLDTMEVIVVKGEKQYQIFQIKFQPLD